MRSIIKIKNKERANRGITLIALVITIIVLLILAGITIATLTGENGILSKTSTANEETKKKEYEEVLKIIGNGLLPDRTINNWDNKTYFDEFEKEIREDKTFKEAEVNRKNDETIIVITKEGYVYQITEDKVEFIGKQGESEIPTLDKSKIIFTYTPSLEKGDWTTQNVVVSIATASDIEEKYELQYSMNGTTWFKYRNRNYDGRKWRYLREAGDWLV